MPNGRSAFAEAEQIRWPAPLAITRKAEEGCWEVALWWGERLIELKKLQRGVLPTLGHLPDDSVHVFARSVGGRFPLIRIEDGQRILSVPLGARFALHGPERMLSDEALQAAGRVTDSDLRPAKELVLGDDEAAVIALAGLRITVREVEKTGRVRINPFADGDFGFFKVATITAFVLAAFLSVLLLGETEETFVDDVVLARVPPVVTRILAPKPPPPPPVVEEAAKKPPKKVASADSKPAPRVNRGTGGEPKKIVGEVGLLGAAKRLGSNPVFTSGLGVDDKLAALQKGPVVGDKGGFGGFEVRGTGPGGGGGAGLEIGGIAGVERPGNGRPDLPDRKLRGRVDPVGPERTRVVGGLDRDQIAKVIRANQNAIKYCYESALNQNPALAGKVAVSFVIGSAGHVTVAEVAESTLGNDGAEQCMLNRIRRWRFPEPKGGGEVTVNFPWMFHPAGGE